MTDLARANRQTLPGLRRHARRARRGRHRRHVPVLRPRPRRDGVAFPPSTSGPVVVEYRSGRAARTASSSASCWWWWPSSRSARWCRPSWACGWRRPRSDSAAATSTARLNDGKAPIPPADLASAPQGGGWKVLATTPPEGGFTDFDPVASLPWAMAIGRAWASDAVLTRIDVGRVSATGVVDLGGEAGSGYRFVSPGRHERWIERDGRRREVADRDRADARDQGDAGARPAPRGTHRGIGAGAREPAARRDPRARPRRPRLRGQAGTTRAT